MKGIILGVIIATTMLTVNVRAMTDEERKEIITKWKIENLAREKRERLGLIQPQIPNDPSSLLNLPTATSKTFLWW